MQGALTPAPQRGGGSATPQMDFLRDHQKYLKCNVGAVYNNFVERKADSRLKSR